MRVGSIRLLALLCILGCVLGWAGCAFRVGDLSVVSSQNTALPIEPLRRTVEGRDCVWRTLIFVPVSGSLFPNIEEAMDRAMEGISEANVVTNLAIYAESAGFSLVLGRECLRVKGDVGVLR